MKVNFSFSQTLQTIHPNQEITIIFAGEALVTPSEEVQIYGVSLNGEPLPIPAGYEAQNLATGEMGAFLGRCREAARKSLKNEGYFAPNSNNRNGGFSPRASDTKYMNDDGDISFPEIHERQ